MIILPAIDLLGAKAVRLLQGDYRQVTVYDDDPLAVARKFEQAGATWLHLVDLDGARSGSTDNRDVICKLAGQTGLRIELGGGIRSMDTIDAYLNAGVSRVVLGTAAVTDEGFAAEAAARYREKIAVGVDLRDGYVAVHGWTQTSTHTGLDFCRRMQQAGVQTLICTDISRDGAMRGTNLALYHTLAENLEINLIASGGVSSLQDVQALSRLGLYGAIVGKAYYTGAVDLPAAIAIGSGEMTI